MAFSIHVLWSLVANSAITHAVQLLTGGLITSVIALSGVARWKPWGFIPKTVVVHVATAGWVPVAHAAVVRVTYDGANWVIKEEMAVTKMDGTAIISVYAPTVTIALLYGEGKRLQICAPDGSRWDDVCRIDKDAGESRLIIDFSREQKSSESSSFDLKE